MDGFKKQMSRIFEGPYDNNIAEEWRLLAKTRPMMETFAKEIDRSVPCEFIYIKINSF